MNQEIFEWLLLLGRWLHITVAVTWIGTSIFFMWLDRTIEFNEQSKKEGHVGELWMVHGGGFYHVEKLLMGPTRVPESLHWFKWESYWTWLSGIFLIAMIFYAGSGTFLLDASVSRISYPQAIALSLFSLVGSWLFYDFLWETKLTKAKPILGHILTLAWFAGMTFLLCHTLSGRAAYMHIGGMLGTWMTANVFLRIIPRQVKMVEASKRGEPVNQEWGKNAKNRSTHNTYFTLPVIFIMLSNHFPSTYGSSYNGLILLLLSVSGAAIREYFVVRIKNPARSKTFGFIGAFVLIATIAVTSFPNSIPAQSSPTGSDVHSKDDHSKPTQAHLADDTQQNQIQGVVHFVGTPPKPEKLLLPLSCKTTGDVYADDVLVKADKLQNVLVRVIRGLKGNEPAQPMPEAQILDQKGCMYQPRVIAVRVGQKVDFLNSDATFHNVKSVTKQNEEFNIAMPNLNDRFTRVFQKPEIVVETKCSVHPWMTAIIAVVDHPFFTVSDSNGEFSIKGLPEGNYTLEAWHEVFGTQTQEIRVTAKSKLNIEFTFKP